MTASRPLQDILSKIKESLSSFDAVCMATALHSLASLRSSPAEYAALPDREEVKSLFIAISRQSQPLQPLPSPFITKQLKAEIWPVQTK